MKLLYLKAFGIFQTQRKMLVSENLPFQHSRMSFFHGELKREDGGTPGMRTWASGGRDFSLGVLGVSKEKQDKYLRKHNIKY